jgi:hypothetical protein
MVGFSMKVRLSVFSKRGRVKRWSEKGREKREGWREGEERKKVAKSRQIFETFNVKCRL